MKLKEGFIIQGMNPLLSDWGHGRSSCRIKRRFYTMNKELYAILIKMESSEIKNMIFLWEMDKSMCSEIGLPVYSIVKKINTAEKAYYDRLRLEVILGR